MDNEQQQFDVKIMVESYRKSFEVKSVIEAETKVKLTETAISSCAHCLFINSMKMIEQNRRVKNQGGY